MSTPSNLEAGTRLSFNGAHAGIVEHVVVVEARVDVGPDGARSAVEETGDRVRFRPTARSITRLSVRPPA